LRTKLAHSTTPTSPGGRRAAAISASGPENDSATSTNGDPPATASITIGSNCSYPSARSVGYRTTTGSTSAGKCFRIGPNNTPLPSSPGRRIIRTEDRFIASPIARHPNLSRPVAQYRST
jgi:hypothetical protein